MLIFSTNQLQQLSVKLDLVATLFNKTNKTEFIVYTCANNEQFQHCFTTNYDNKNIIMFNTADCRFHGTVEVKKGSKLQLCLSALNEKYKKFTKQCFASNFTSPYSDLFSQPINKPTNNFNLKPYDNRGFLNPASLSKKFKRIPSGRIAPLPPSITQNYFTTSTPQLNKNTKLPPINASSISFITSAKSKIQLSVKDLLC
jgi:hypothetical protein